MATSRDRFVLMCENTELVDVAKVFCEWSNFPVRWFFRVTGCMMGLIGGGHIDETLWDLSEKRCEERLTRAAVPRDDHLGCSNCSVEGREVVGDVRSSRTSKSKRSEGKKAVHEAQDLVSSKGRWK